MTQQLIIYALRNRIEYGAVRCYYGDWIGVYRGRETRPATEAEEITDNEYIRHCLSLFEPTGFYLDDVILGPAKQPTEGKVFGNVIEECFEAFFSACCEDVKYTQSQEYFADFAENNEFEFYSNGIRIRHR